MVGRIVAVACACAATALLGAPGCTTIPLQYTSVGSELGGGDASDATSSDAGEDASAPGEDAGSGPQCPCDASAGLGCCILGGMATPFCTADGVACTNAHGVFSACQAYDPSTESECCWNGSPAAGGSTHYASSCGKRPASCTGSADCPAGQTCEVTMCSTMNISIGACGVMPACP